MSPTPIYDRQKVRLELPHILYDKSNANVKYKKSVARIFNDIRATPKACSVTYLNAKLFDAAPLCRLKAVE